MSMQRETCLSHAEPYSPEESYSSIEPCSFWALEMVVVQWEGTREICHQVFEGCMGQIQVWFSDCSVLGLAPGSSASQACLCPQQWFVWPLLLWVLMILSSIKQLLWNVLCHVMLFGHLGNQYSDGFSRIRTDFQLFQRENSLSRVEALLFKKVANMLISIAEFEIWPRVLVWC